MREKIVRHRLSVPGAVNIRVSRTRTVGPRNKQKPNKKVMFALANTPTQNKAKTIKKNYRNLHRTQTGKGLADNLANVRIIMGSKAINSVTGKKLLEKWIEKIQHVFKYGVSKIKNKKV